MRNATNLLLEQVQQGLLDKDNLIRDLLGWMSEDDVAEFVERNDYVSLHENEDEDEDEDVCEYCDGTERDGDGNECPWCAEDWGSIGPPT